jgi:hypothetical protein
MRAFLLMCASVYTAVMVLVMIFAFTLGIAYLFTGPSETGSGSSSLQWPSRLACCS